MMGIKKNITWAPLQVNEEVVLAIDLCVSLSSGIVEVVTSNKCWSLLDVREHLKIKACEGINTTHFKVKKIKVDIYCKDK